MKLIKTVLALSLSFLLVLAVPEPKGNAKDLKGLSKGKDDVPLAKSGRRADVLSGSKLDSESSQ